jgi:hypothetical protein
MQTPGGGEERAIAAERDDRIGFDAGKIGAAIGIDPRDRRALLHPADPLIEHRADIGLARVGNDEQLHPRDMVTERNRAPESARALKPTALPWECVPSQSHGL